MKVKCPNCSVMRTIENDQIDPKHKTRCSKRINGCGITYYSLKNIVPEIEQKPQKIEQFQNNSEQFQKSMDVATKRLTEYKTSWDLKDDLKKKIMQNILAINYGHQKYKELGYNSNHEILSDTFAMVSKLR